MENDSPANVPIPLSAAADPPLAVAGQVELGPHLIGKSLSLSRKGLRHGHGQDAIAALVKDLPAGTHLTAPEVYSRARELGLNVSLSTVYRTLHTLKDHGNVTTLSGERGRRYEAAGSGTEHDHLICVRCGLTIEFFDDLIRGFGKTVAQRKGFEHKSSRFDILGICSDCKAKDEDHKIEQAVAGLANSVACAEEAIAMARNAISSFEARKTARGQEGSLASAEKLQEALSHCDEVAALFAASPAGQSGT